VCHQQLHVLGDGDQTFPNLFVDQADGLGQCTESDQHVSQWPPVRAARERDLAGGGQGARVGGLRVGEGLGGPQRPLRAAAHE